MHKYKKSKKNMNMTKIKKTFQKHIFFYLIISYRKVFNSLFIKACLTT